MISTDHVTEANLTADVVSSVLTLANTALGEGKKETLADAVTALITARDTEHTRAEAYGALPGALPTNPASKGEPEGGEALDNDMSAFSTSVDAELDEYRKKTNKN
ncbi:hypothetical protein [Pedobacter sp. NJ-S-72]